MLAQVHERVTFFIVTEQRGDCRLYPVKPGLSLYRMICVSITCDALRVVKLLCAHRLSSGTVLATDQRHPAFVFLYLAAFLGVSTVF